MRDEYNEHDENAIEVLTMEFKQIGYIQKGLAAKLAPLMDEGQELYCEVENITGGEEGKETLGCNIRIKLGKTKPKAVAFSKEPVSLTDEPKNSVGKLIPPVGDIETKKKRKGLFSILWNLVKWAVIIFLSLIGILFAIGLIVYRVG